eukprot:722619-Rhodomonas_salina.1
MNTRCMGSMVARSLASDTAGKLCVCHPQQPTPYLTESCWSLSFLFPVHSSGLGAGAPGEVLVA